MAIYKSSDTEASFTCLSVKAGDLLRRLQLHLKEEVIDKIGTNESESKANAIKYPDWILDWIATGPQAKTDEAEAFNQIECDVDLAK